MYTKALNEANEEKIYEEVDKILSKMPELSGSEKQISWAKDIRKNAIGTAYINIKLSQSRGKGFEKDEAAFKDILGQLTKIFEKSTDSGKIIDKRAIFEPREITNLANNMVKSKYV